MLLIGNFISNVKGDYSKLLYYNHYATEFAFKKAINLDTMAVVHFAISACK